jgi:uncharacterized protein (DUF1778 family)
MTTALRDDVKRAELPDRTDVPEPRYRQVNVRLPTELFRMLEEAARLDQRNLSSAVAIAVVRWARSVRAQGDAGNG